MVDPSTAPMSTSAPLPQGYDVRASLVGEVYVLEIDAACREGKFRRLVVCPLEGRVSVRAALQEAAREFERLFGGRPQFGFMRKMPKSAVSDQLLAGSGVVEVGDLMLLEAEWMLERCVAVGGKAVSG